MNLWTDRAVLVGERQLLQIIDWLILSLQLVLVKVLSLLIVDNDDHGCSCSKTGYIPLNNLFEVTIETT